MSQSQSFYFDPLQGPSADIIITSEGDRQCFNFFRSWSADSIGTSLQTTLWPRLILQASHASSTVLHAAIAIGALHKRLEFSKTLSTHTKEALPLGNIALVQYSKSMKELSQQLRSGHHQAVLYTLVTCFLFVQFEFQQGNDVAAYTHMRNGMAILRQHLGRNGILDRTVNMELLRIYNLVDFQLTMAFGDPSLASELLPSLGYDRLVLPPCPPGPPENQPKGDASPRQIKEAAYRELDAVQIQLARDILQIMLFCHKATGKFPDRKTIPKALAEEREKLINLIEPKPRVIDELIDRNGSLYMPTDIQRLTIWKVHCRIVLLRLQATLQPSEKIDFRPHRHIFAEIVKLASSLLYPVNLMRFDIIPGTMTYLGEGPVPIFAFIGGLIQPLSFTAARCDDAHIRERALFMLESRPWREGAWDSSVMARVARRRCEELRVSREMAMRSTRAL